NRISLCIGNILKVAFTGSVYCRAFGERISLPHEFPTRSGNQDIVQKGVLCISCLYGFRPVFPEPAHGRRENGGTLFATVSPFTPDMIYFITGKFQRPFHGFICLEPVSAVDIQVIRTILQKNADRLGFVFPDQDRITVGAAETGIGSDGAEYSGKFARMFPGGRKRTDSTAAGSADCTIVAVFGKTDRPAVACFLLFH